MKMKKMAAVPIALSLMVLCLGTGWALAQTGPAGEEVSVRELFIPVFPAPLSAQSAQAERDREVVRSRFVHVNLDRLAELESIALNFFDDVTVTAVRERVEHRSENRYTWFGGVPGKEFSDVVLTVENGDLVGGVRIDGKLYRVQPAGDGIHTIRQVDPRAFPSEDRSDARIADVALDKTPLQWDLYRDEGDIIDIMVVYTDDVARASSNISAEIQYAIDLANATFDKSFVYKRLRLVHTAQVNYDETGNSDLDLDRITYRDGFLDEVHHWRDEYRADIVSFWVERMDTWCGTGFSLTSIGNPPSPDQGFESKAFNVVKRSCAADNFTLAHEVGHNMGAGHDLYSGGGGAFFPYSHGYIWLGSTWLESYCRPTVMAYTTYCRDNSYSSYYRIGRWSNPDIDWRECDITGLFCTNWTRLGIPGVSENARTLNETGLHVANFRYGGRILRMAATHAGDNSIHYASWEGYSVNQWTFSGFSPIGGASTEPPGMAEFMGRHYMAVKAAYSNKIYMRFQRNLGDWDWSGWQTIAGTTSHSPALAEFNGRLYMVVKGGSSNDLYMRSMNASGTWDPSWTQVPGSTSEAPALAVFNNRLYLFIKGANSTGIYYRSMDTAGTWDHWAKLPGGTSKPVGLTVFNNRLYVFVKGASTNNILYRSMDTSRNWSGWATLPGQTTERPSVSVVYDRLLGVDHRLYVGVKAAGSSNAYIRSMNLSGQWDSAWMMVPANTNNAPVLSTF